MVVGPETIKTIAEESGLTRREVSRELEAYCWKILGGLLGSDKNRLDTNLVSVHGHITRLNKTVAWVPDDDFLGSTTARVNRVVDAAARGLCPVFASLTADARLAFKHDCVYGLPARDIFTHERFRDTLEYEIPGLDMDNEETTVRFVVNAVQRAASHAGLAVRGCVSRDAGVLDIARRGRRPELVAMLQLAQLGSSHTARARS
jgi:hypothetical protein